GLRLLALEHSELADTLRQGNAPTAEQLQAVGPDGIEGLFWTANPWAAAINVGKADPGLVAQLAIAKQIMKRGHPLAPTYYWAGPAMTLGAMEASIPAALAGDPKAATAYFQEAIRLTEGKHLMMKVLYGKAVGTQAGD